MKNIEKLPSFTQFKIENISCDMESNNMHTSIHKDESIEQILGGVIKTCEDSIEKSIRKKKIYQKALQNIDSLIKKINEFANTKNLRVVKMVYNNQEDGLIISFGGEGKGEEKDMNDAFKTIMEGWEPWFHYDKAQRSGKGSIYFTL